MKQIEFEGENPLFGFDYLFRKIDANSLNVVVRLTGLSEEEATEFNSKIQIRFKVVDDILFLFFKFGNMNWMDSAYYRVPDNPIDTRVSANAYLTLCNGDLGKVIVRRTLRIDPSKWRELIDVINKQVVIYDYGDRVSRIRYSTPTERLLEGSIPLV